MKKTILLRVIIFILHGLSLPDKYFSRVKYLPWNRFKNQSAFVCRRLAILLSFSLMSCSFFISDDSRGPLGGNTNNANFILDQVEGRVVTASVNGLPEEIQIFYKACFRDFIHQDNTLQNSVFKIHLFETPDIRGNLGKEKKEGELNRVSTNNSTEYFPDPENPINTSIEEGENPLETEECSESSSFLFSEVSNKKSCLKIRTDSSGCLIWTEVYPYYPVNQSVWFHYSRTFEGTGVNHGVITIPMAVNPWLSFDPSGSAIQLQLVDLRYHPVDQKWKLVRLKDEDITQCLSCPSDRETKDCEICQKKKMSLSSVIAHFEKQADRPRLWIDEMDSSISQEHIVIDQNPEDMPQEQRQALKQFKVCHFDVKENCDPPGRFFKVRLRIPLHIKVRNYRNEEELLPLTRGNYSLKAYLFLQGSDGRNIVLHRDMDFISTPLHRGSKGTALNPEFYLHIPYENYSLRAFLGLKIQAEGELKSFFLPFESVFSFSDRLSSVIETNSLTLDRNTLSFYEKQPAKTEYSLMDSYNLTGSWLQINRTVEGFRRAGWDIKLNRFRFSEISMRENECPTPVDRTIRYVGEVCIIDPLTNKVVPNIDITIQRQDFFTKNSLGGEIVNISSTSTNGINIASFNKEGNHYDLTGELVSEEDKYKADTSGCLQWVDHLYHKWYDREKYFVRKMIFSKREWGFEGERMIAINPWHWGFVFFQDITQLGQSSIRTDRTDASRAARPKIILHDFRSLLVDLVYTIDRWLGINIFQNILFLFKARVERPDNISVALGGQRPSAQDLRRGYYFLRFILVKSHTEEAGGKGNIVVDDREFRKQYIRSQDFNTNNGWSIGREQNQTGQMMNTNLEYITHYETYVQVRDGIVNAYINFLFNLDQFIFIGSNNRLIVQIFPTDPKYYVYNPDSCEVDPSRSIFEPFEYHDLISQPFMGTFVPGDQRNWNIFKPLNDNVNLDVHKQIEKFIKQGKNSEEHLLFMKLQTNLTVETINDVSSNASQKISNIGFDFEKLYEDMDNFLRVDVDPAILSAFNQTKNTLIESIDKVDSDISTILNGFDSNALQQQSFFTKIQQLLQEALSLLNNFTLPSNELKQEVEKIQKAFNQEVVSFVSSDISPEKAEQLLKTERLSNKWFHPELSFPENEQDWSGFNMNLFAKAEGLNVISVDNENVINEFLDDLKDSAKIHNTYYKKYKRLKADEMDQKHKAFQEMDQKHVEDYNVTYEWNQHNENVQNLEEEAVFLLNNFKLLEGDDFYTVRQKINQMFLPDFSRSWLDKILKDGVHVGTLYKPEVMTFFHSLCVFWFDKFYKKYLKKHQLKTIYNKHLEHFNYYKATLDYLQNSNSPAQYVDLFRAMQLYNLQSLDKGYFDNIDDTFLYNPFKSPQDKIEESWLSDLLDLFHLAKREEQETFSNKTVTQNLYDSLEYILNQTDQDYRATTSYNHTFSSSMSPQSYFFDRLKEYRHPLFKCIADPFNFFHIEEKIIVGDISSDYSELKYEHGLTKSYTMQRAFDYAYSAQWSMSRSFSTSLGTGFVVPGTVGIGDAGKFLNPLNTITSFLSFSGVKLSSEWSTSRSDTTANRRQQSLRFAEEGLYLQINHSVISIGLKRYRHCLIVRAKNHAFEGYNKNVIWRKDLAENFIYQIPYIKSGLMICSQDIDTTKRQDPFSIMEDYFYMYQLVPGDRGQFQNPLSFRNRPFVISVRGITEMEKLGFLLHSSVEPDKTEGQEDYNPFKGMTNPYNRVPSVTDGTRKAIQKAKIWDKTGFYPGVYNRKHDQQHYFFTPSEKKKNMLEQLGAWLNNGNPLGPIRSSDDETTPLTERGESP